MKKVVLKGEVREIVGKKEAKKLRAEDKVPAVMYGGDAPVHFSVPFSDLRKVIYTPSVYLIELDLGGEVHTAMMQDIQWHPVQEQVLHIDFLKLIGDKPVKMDIPLKVTGSAKGIQMGGKLNTNLRRLKVKALAADLPDSIDVDVTELGIGDGVKVADLSIENVEFLDVKSNVVVSVGITRAAKSEAGGEGEEGEEGEEGAEGEGEEAATEE